MRYGGDKGRIEGNAWFINNQSLARRNSAVMAHSWACKNRCRRHSKYDADYSFFFLQSLIKQRK